jgi:hypothetical protein
MVPKEICSASLSTLELKIARICEIFVGQADDSRLPGLPMFKIVS